MTTECSIRETIYNAEFFSRIGVGCFAAARAVVPILHETIKFRSAVDVGCGTGAWLLVAKELGVQRILGFDNSVPSKEHQLLQVDEMQIWNLERPLSPLRVERFEVCFCLEVAEHLSPTRDKSLVEDLCLLSDAVVFSGAIPLQGGTGHINERWPEYWAELFRHHNYIPWDGIRDRIWDNRKIPWWYRQNIIVFFKATALASYFSDEVPRIPKKLTRIHPEGYLWRLSGANRSRFNLRCDEYHSATGAADVYGP